MIYVISGVSAFILSLFAVIYFQRNSIKKLNKKLSDEIQSRINLSESVRLRDEQIDNLRIQVSRNEEINRESQRRLNEIENMNLKDHISNLANF